MIAFLSFAPPLVGGLTPPTNATAPIRHRLPDFFEELPGRRSSAIRQHDSWRRPPHRLAPRRAEVLGPPSPWWERRLGGPSGGRLLRPVPVQPRVGAGRLEQLLVRPLLGDPAVVENHDPA